MHAVYNFLLVTHPSCTLVNIRVFSTQSFTKQLHVFEVISFYSLVRPSSDIYNVKSLAKIHTKTFYVEVGKISRAH
jgi:hypothetical protein